MMNLLRFVFVLMSMLFLMETARSQSITLTQLSTNFNSPIGADYHEPTDSLILSVNYSSGQPHNLERIEFDGSHVQYSTLAGLTNELKIATVRSAGNPGGFVVGDVFTGNGNDGEIVRVTNDGATVMNPWVSLPGSGNGLLRGSLYIDRTGVFGGDLIVCTTAGEVWRIDNAGNPTMLTDLNVHLEGLISVPADSALYGPLAGTIIAGAEGQSLLWSISPVGTATSYAVGMQVEDIDIILANQSFFGVNFGTNRLLAAPASNFAGYAGDLLLADESVGAVGLYRLHWSGKAFEVNELTLGTGSAVPGQWEHVTFAPVGVIPLPDCAITPAGPLTVVVGEEVIFAVEGVDAEPSDVVTVSATGIPAGAVLAPPLPASGNPAQVSFNWIPGNADIGTHVMVFTATDSSGLATACEMQIEVATGGPACFTLDFEHEDDRTSRLVNGQDISTPPEFGLLVDISAAGPNLGPAIFDSTPGGPNDPGSDPDLLVGLKNILILQALDKPHQTTTGIFDDPDDSEYGGVFVFDFHFASVLRSIDLVDICPQNHAQVVLVDVRGNSRTYRVPNGWTTDVTVSGTGWSTLDLTTLVDQPGAESVATAVQDPGFNPRAVAQLVVYVNGSAGLDNLVVCPGREIPATENDKKSAVSVK